jgi:hypothetical protein
MSAAIGKNEIDTMNGKQVPYRSPSPRAVRLWPNHPDVGTGKVPTTEP